MKDQHKHIDDFFRKKVFDYSTPPPANVWDDIEKSLSQPKKRKVAFLYFKIAAGFIFLAGMTAFYLRYINNHPSQNEPKIVAEKSISSKNIYDTIANKEYINNNDVVKTVNRKTNNVTTIQNSIPARNSSAVKNESPTSIVLNTEKRDETTEMDATPINKNEKETGINSISGIKPSISYATELDLIIRNNISDKKTITSKPDELLIDELIAENEIKKERNMNWSIGGQAGPQYTYRNLKNTDRTASNNTNYDNYDSPMIAYAGGLQIEIEPSRRLSVQSGVYYSKVGQNISSRYVSQPRNDYFPVESYAADQRPVEVVNSIGTFAFEKSNTNITSSNSRTNDRVSSKDYLGVETTEEKADYSGEQYFEFIEIPLLLRYKVIDHKIGINLIGGVNTDIMVNNYVQLSNSSNETIRSKTGDLKTFNYSGTIGFGVEYPLSKKVIFSIEPYFKYYLTSISKTSTTDAYPYMVGIMTGLNYSF